MLACSSSARETNDDAGAPVLDPPVCPVPGEQFDAAGASPSFAEDVVPIFLRSCGGLLCHEGRTRPPGDLFLGDLRAGLEPGDLDEIARQLWLPAKAAPQIRRIEPGSSERSYLMLKMDGCQNRTSLECNGAPVAFGPCGNSMPLNSRRRPTEERDLIRRWIAEGAVVERNDGGP